MKCSSRLPNAPGEKRWRKMEFICPVRWSIDACEATLFLSCSFFRLIKFFFCLIAIALFFWCYDCCCLLIMLIFSQLNTNQWSQWSCVAFGENHFLESQAAGSGRSRPATRQHHASLPRLRLLISNTCFASTTHSL